MGFNIREFFKGLLISEENTNTPKQIEITPGGVSDTKTTITSSQTVDVTVTIPDDTTTLLGTHTVQNVSNKTITDSTLDNSPIGSTTPSTGAFTSLEADTADIDGGTIDNTTIGATTPAPATVTTLVAATADINGGTIDNTVIGGSVPAAGTFTDLEADTLLVNGSSVVDENSAQTLNNKSLVDDTTHIIDATDATIHLDFDASGTTATKTTLKGNQTADRIVTLPDATDTLVGKNTTDILTNKTLTTPTITNPDIDGGSLDDTVIGANTPAAADFTTIDTTGDLNVGGNTIITGDLTVNGTTTTLNTQTLDVEDANISVNILGNDASAEGAGLTVNRTGTDGSLIYKDASPSKFAVGPLGSEDNVVAQTVTQTLSNKSLVDANTAIVDSVDPTKQIKFDAAGTTGTSTTLLGSQTTNKILTLPDATDTLVGKATTDLLTNKTLQYLQQAVATNAALTGTNQTLNTITTGVIRLTNGSLASLAGISAGASGQTIMVENKTGATVNIFNDSASASAADRILTGTATTVEMKADATLIFIYDTTSSRWHLAGGSGSGTGTGSGGVNFIPTGDAESTNPFIGYQYFSTTRPVASAGSPAVTGVAATISSSSPLAGNNSFLITKSSGANAQGLAVDIPFTVSPAYRAKVNTIEFDFQLVSGTFQVGSTTQDSDLIVYIIDVDANTVIEPSNFKLLSNSTTISSKFSAQFQTSSTSVNYRLTFYTATTNTPNYSLKVDNIKVGPSQYVYGTPFTDLRSVGTITIGATTTAPTKGTTVIDNLSYARHGDLGMFIYNYQQTTAGTAGNGDYLFSLPSGLSFDLTKVTAYTGAASALNTAGSHTAMLEAISYGKDNTNGTFAIPVVFNATQFRLIVLQSPTSGSYISSAANPLSNATSSYKLSFRAPISGWSSSVQTSDQTDTRIVSSSFFKNGGLVSGGATITTWTGGSDTHGAFNSSTGVYTVPVSGDYDFTSGVACNLSSVTLVIRVDGTNVLESAGSTNGTIGFSGKLRNLRAGQLVTLANSTGSSFTVVANNTQTYFTLTRVSGPATIAQIETIACKYTLTATQNINTTFTAVTVAASEYDTHGAFNSANATFTAPATGLYEFALERCSITFIPTANFNVTDINISVAGQSLVNYIATFNGTQQQIAVGGAKITVRLNGGQTAQFTSARGANFSQCQITAGSVTVRRVGN